jgi:hypothetical protein
MSRSGYTDDGGDYSNLWRGAVHRAIKGKRGQDALKELAAAMDCMPEKKLASESLVTENGEFCTLGVLGHARGLDMSKIDPDDWDEVAKKFNLAPAMVREIVYENDESLVSYERIDFELCGPVRYFYPYFENHQQTARITIPEDILAGKRWQRMRDWVARQLNEGTA